MHDDTNITNCLHLVGFLATPKCSPSNVPRLSPLWGAAARTSRFDRTAQLVDALGRSTEDSYRVPAVETCRATDKEREELG